MSSKRITTLLATKKTALSNHGVILILWANLDFSESLKPSDNGAPGGIRTPDQTVRSHLSISN